MSEISLKLNKEHEIQKYYLILFLIDLAVIDVKRRTMFMVMIRTLCVRIQIFYRIDIVLHSLWGQRRDLPLFPPLPPPLPLMMMMIKMKEV